MSRTERILLGLDPGLARIGYAVLAEGGQRLRLVTYGTLTTPAGTDRGERLVTIARGLRRLIRRTKPERAFLEKLFFQKNTTTAMAVSEARGVLLLVCAEAGLPVAEFTPNEIKRIVTGNGSADKPAMAKMIRLILRLKSTPKDDDAVDAVAIALSGALDQGRGYGH